MVLDIIVMLIKFLLGVVKWVLIVGSFAVLPFAVSAGIWYVYYYRKGYRLKVRKYSYVIKHSNIFARLFRDFPRRFILDSFAACPDDFPFCGLVMIVGEQGSGKTTTAAYMLRALKAKYPMCKVLSNTPLTFADGDILSPDDIIFQNNGRHGTIKFLDEIHSWFNSQESQYFPPEMLSEVSQQRKQFSLIVGTAQRFDRIAKAIRQQTHYIIKPVTLFGCLTICRVYKPNVTDSGEVVKLRGVKTFFFVHDEDLRECFDTFAKIKRLSVKGWKPRSEQLSSDDSPHISVDVNSAKK